MTMPAAMLLAAISAAAPVRIAELSPDLHDCRPVTIEGTAIDIVNDEVDDRYSVILLEDDNAFIPVFITRETATNRWNYARIRVAGRYMRRINGQRQFSGPYVEAFDPSRIEMLAPPPDDLADAPPLDLKHYMSPSEIMHLGRRSVAGRVLAAWGKSELMLRAMGQTVNLKLAAGVPLPRTGSTIQAAGFPVSNLYRVNLNKAHWKYIDADLPAEPPERIWSLDEIFPESLAPGAGEPGRQRIDSDCHGKIARIRGTVCHVLAGSDPATRRFVVDDGRRRVDVEVCGIDGLEAIAPDYRIEATGYCRLETDLWSPHEIFPQIRSLSIIPRDAGDVAILAHPPWWTPRRLIGVIGLLLPALAGIIAYNRYLSRRIERRGRQLHRAKLANDVNRTLAVIRVRERTNLAIELHDSLSQYLTAVALEIDSAVRKIAAGGDFLAHLTRASHTLRSCRNELRNCLWDLRNDTLGSPTMRETLRQAIQPQIGEARLDIDFNVRRAILSDNIAYATIRIARELAVNAVRHGSAGVVAISGAIRHGKLSFTATDDGTGFDPATAAGPREGHYGLLGIRERVHALGGVFTIESSPGSGTVANVTLPTTDAMAETEIHE